MAARTREEWLNQAATELEPLFAEAGQPKRPQVRVSVGFPFASRKAIGQCWSKNASNDKRNEVFVSPFIENPVRVLDILVHELCHAYLDCKDGHKGAFRKLALAVGLQGKMTATEASPKLVEKLEAVIAKIGPFPHAGLNCDKVKTKKQTTRLLKAQCPACGYVIRVTRQWADTGLPMCTCGHVFVLPEDDDSASDDGE
jgi:hypothetical protein